jgi:restriction endonuclease S subunit
MNNSAEAKVKVGFKQTEVGLIPEDWEAKRLDEILRVIGGGTFKSKDRVSDGMR